MRRYHMVSGIVFSFIGLAQLTRTLLAWPIQIATVSVPVWISGLAFLVMGSLAVWAFRSAGNRPPAV